MDSAVVIVFCLALYFVPTIVAVNRGHHNSTAIIVTNILAGWIIIGWAISLIWACTAVKSELGGGKKNG